MPHALWNLAFRPFFLLAGAAAAVLIFLWLAVWTGLMPGPRYFPSMILWHAHEMLFGFATAVVVGFLMTASQNWTGKRGIHGWKLQLLAGVWLVARLMPWLLAPPSYLYAATDLAFLVLAVVFLAPYLLQASQKRNMGLLLVLAVLAGANALVHGEALGILEDSAYRGLALGVGMLTVLIVVIGGRVIPAFTRNAEASAHVRSWRPLDLACVGFTAVYALSDTFLPQSPFFGVVTLAAALANGTRWLLWDPWSTRHQPMLWILFSGYLWLVIGLFLRGFGVWQPIAPSLGIHAIAVGSIGVLIYGMMPRVSLGHTGRPIRARRALVTGFVLINAAAAMRVVVVGLAPLFYRNAVVIAGLLWAVAFLIFFGLFLQVLTSPRVDGRPG
ncbi:NnrS family protein [Oligoflexus tunisiensis]|uniref:NnrS family protein n=1 Tax=Oligoflexus tunisiensis TaxID=708132 RepID=UPI000A693705|nr:NnrS family protein [Oligoflexus tunisiensis]